MAMNDYDEKRNFIRMKVDTPANITVVNGEESYKGICVDLSGGGLLVKLKNSIDLGTPLKVTIVSDHGHNPMLVARTTVTRCIASKEGDYELGLEIEELLT